ncbi:MAG: MalY/PatB family protein [Opitutales bacterium]
MNEPYDFSSVIERRNTGSLKWDKYAGRRDRHSREVLPLWVADMDFAAAPEIIDALHGRVGHGVFGYTVPYAEVERAVLAYLGERHGYSAQRDWLFFIHGCVPALNVFAAAFGGDDKEILTCTPVYPPFLTAPGWQGGKLVTSHLTLQGDRWTFDWDDLAAKVSEKTTGFILCNPHNPVGRVFSREELRMLGDFCERHNLILCSDEIHCDLVFDPHQHIMTATLDEALAQRTVTLHAPSKTYNLPGLSAAFAVIPNSRLRAQFKQAARGFVTEVNTLGYTGMTAAYTRGEPWRQALLERLAANRDLLYGFVPEHLGRWMSLQQPLEATYLTWLNVEPMLNAGIEHPAEWLIENAGVGLSPGGDFGDRRFLRLNIGCPETTLREALERIRAALADL